MNVWQSTMSDANKTRKQSSVPYLKKLNSSKKQFWWCMNICFIILLFYSPSSYIQWTVGHFKEIILWAFVAKTLLSEIPFQWHATCILNSFSTTRYISRWLYTLGIPESLWFSMPSPTLGLTHLQMGAIRYHIVIFNWIYITKRFTYPIKYLGPILVSLSMYCLITSARLFCITSITSPYSLSISHVKF